MESGKMADAAGKIIAVQQTETFLHKRREEW